MIILSVNSPRKWTIFNDQAIAQEFEVNLTPIFPQDVCSTLKHSTIKVNNIMLIILDLIEFVPVLQV